MCTCIVTLPCRGATLAASVLQPCTRALSLPLTVVAVSVLAPLLAWLATEPALPPRAAEPATLAGFLGGSASRGEPANSAHSGA